MYDELYEAWKKEKEHEEIQPLPRDFYAKLAEYQRRLKEESRMLDEKTLRGRLLQKEGENVRRLIEELIQTRYGKIMRRISAGENVPTTNLTESEANLYDEVCPPAESYLGLLNNVLQGRLLKAEEKTKPRIMPLRILQDMPAIVGADMKTYGPFKREDVAALPLENARVLIRQGAAEEIEVR